MTEYEVATLIARSIALVIGVGQLVVVWYEIRMVSVTGERRAREQDRRHDEAMAALRARRDAMLAAHGGAMAALRPLVARDAVSRD